MVDFTYEELRSHLGHKISCIRIDGGVAIHCKNCNKHLFQKAKPFVAKVYPKDKRWKICMACVSTWAERHDTREISAGWKKRYRNKVKRWVKDFYSKYTSKTIWKKPCSGKCNRTLEFTVMTPECERKKEVANGRI